MTTRRRDLLGGGRPHVDTHVSLISPHLLSLQTKTRHQCELVPPQRLQPVRAREALKQHPLSQDPCTREKERSSYWAGPLRAGRCQFQWQDDHFCRSQACSPARVSLKSSVACASTPDPRESSLITLEALIKLSLTSAIQRRAPLVQMVVRFVRTPRGASSIPMLLVCFARRPILHMFDFHAHAREGVSLRVSPYVSNFISDARLNTYVRLGLSTVIGFSSGDRESREIGTHGV